MSTTEVTRPGLPFTNPIVTQLEPTPKVWDRGEVVLMKSTKKDASIGQTET